MDAFINVIKKDPPVRIKGNNMLDKYNGLPYNYLIITLYRIYIDYLI